MARGGGSALELASQLADGARALREHVVVVDRLEIDLAREDEVAVVEAGVAVERLLERCANRVLDEAGLQVRVLDDEQLVRALQQRIDGRAHRALDDPDEVLGVDARVGADEQRPASALVVRRERDELEDAVDVLAGEPGLEQPLGRGAAHHSLRTGAGIDPRRLDADHPPHALRGRRRDPDQLRDLLRRQARDGRAPLERVLRLDPHLGAQRLLPVHDVPRDVLRERLDQEGLADHDLVDRLAEELRKARHVDALLGRIEVDGARDLGRKRLLAALVLDADRLRDAGHARARQPELHLRRGRLEVVDEFVACHR